MIDDDNNNNDDDDDPFSWAKVRIKWAAEHRDTTKQTNIKAQTKKKWGYEMERNRKRENEYNNNSKSFCSKE